MNWKSPHGRKLPSPKTFPVIMGILNVGTDSFSDGGKYYDVASAVAHAESMISEGAEIIDIGAESTRPSAKALSLEDELAVLLPRLKAVRKTFADVAISVDTYKPEVAEIAIKEGADIINDVYAFRQNGRYKMAQVASSFGVPIIITHCCRGEISNGDFFRHFLTGMKERIDSAVGEGVSPDMIVADVGIGFGKTCEENFELVRRLREVRSLGYPILLGVSRKSMFSDVAGQSIDMRDIATSIVSAFVAQTKGCDVLRVHNVASNITAMKTIKNLI